MWVQTQQRAEWSDKSSHDIENGQRSRFYRRSNANLNQKKIKMKNLLSLYRIWGEQAAHKW